MNRKTLRFINLLFLLLLPFSVVTAGQSQSTESRTLQWPYLQRYGVDSIVFTVPMIIYPDIFKFRLCARPKNRVEWDYSIYESSKDSMALVISKDWDNKKIGQKRIPILLDYIKALFLKKNVPIYTKKRGKKNGQSNKKFCDMTVKVYYRNMRKPQIYKLERKWSYYRTDELDERFSKEFEFFFKYLICADQIIECECW